MATLPTAGRLFVLNQAGLAVSRERWQQHDGQTVELVGQITRAADAALSHANPTVVSKTQVPPSGDKHDYFSVPPYSWPVQGQPSAPYVTKDGQQVPDYASFTDFTNLKQLEQDTLFLSLAYFFTHDQKYADKAIDMLAAWFLRPATRMNPNLNYAQTVRNSPDRLPVGIIDAANLPMVLDAIVLLDESGALSPTAKISLEQWFKQYLQWLTGSQQGAKEAAFGNNRTTWYYAQVAAVAKFAGDTAAAQTAVAKGKSLIDAQIDAEGKLPAEISRTKSWDYTAYDLDAFVRLAWAGVNLGASGVDLFNYSGAQGSLRLALGYAAQHSQTASDWPYPNSTKFDPSRAQPAFLIGAYVYKGETLQAANSRTPAAAAAQLSFPM